VAAALCAVETDRGCDACTLASAAASGLSTASSSPAADDEGTCRIVCLSPASAASAAGLLAHVGAVATAAAAATTAAGTGYVDRGDAAASSAANTAVAADDDGARAANSAFASAFSAAPEARSGSARASNEADALIDAASALASAATNDDEVRAVPVLASVSAPKDSFGADIAIATPAVAEYDARTVDTGAVFG
jgi:hypothetical protein